jgi:sulfur carrier protein ThiS
MKLLYINNDGSGFADHIEVDDETTVAAFFEEKMAGRSASDFLIRVNRQPVAPDQVLRSGDRVSITPSKVEGA